MNVNMYTLRLYRKWNKQNVRDLKSVLDMLDPSTVAHIRLAAIIEGLKAEGQFLDIDIKYAEQVTKNQSD